MERYLERAIRRHDRVHSGHGLDGGWNSQEDARGRKDFRKEAAHDAAHGLSGIGLGDRGNSAEIPISSTDIKTARNASRAVAPVACSAGVSGQRNMTAEADRGYRTGLDQAMDCGFTVRFIHCYSCAITPKPGLEYATLWLEAERKRFQEHLDGIVSGDMCTMDSVEGGGLWEQVTADYRAWVQAKIDEFTDLIAKNSLPK